MARKQPVSVALLREADFGACIPSERISAQTPGFAVNTITFSLFCVLMPEEGCVSVSLSIDSADEARTVEGISLAYKKTCKIRNLPPHFLDSPLLIRHILSHEGTVHDISSLQIISDIAAAIITKCATLSITTQSKNKNNLTIKLSCPFYEDRAIIAKEELETLGVSL